MEENLTTPPQTSWLVDAAKKGAVLGVIHILIHLIFYIGFPDVLTGFTYVGIILIVNISYCIMQGLQWRQEIGGYMSFGAAFKYTFILLAVNGLVALVYMAIFLFIVPSYPSMMAESQLETSIYWAEKFGAPESAVDDMRDKFDMEKTEGQFGHSGIFIGYPFALIFYALGALIVALFVRRNQPEIM